MNHPTLAKTIQLLFNKSISTFIEPYTPISTPRAILVSHSELKTQPLILRYKERILERFYPSSNHLLITSEHHKTKSTDSYQVIRLSPLFGVIPDELKGVFPLVQHERIPLTFTGEDIVFIDKFIQKYENSFQIIETHPNLNLDSKILSKFNTFNKKEKSKRQHDQHKLNAIIDYQFGSGTHDIFNQIPVTIKRSRKTGILRQFLHNGEVKGTIRPSDFTIIPTATFAENLFNIIPPPRLRVIASSESIPFITQNKDLLAKFVKNVDPEIRCGEEVFIIDEEGIFKNSGKARLSAREMVDFSKGVAVQVRK
jgi:archaeosine-15-forming tRNA-guanine transglycosylase